MKQAKFNLLDSLGDILVAIPKFDSKSAQSSLVLLAAGELAHGSWSIVLEVVAQTGKKKTMAINKTINK